MISEAVISELFDIRYVVQDHIIEHIVDELWIYKITVEEVINCDSVIYMDLRAKSHTGELKIDRFSKRFMICMKIGNELIPPAIGDWKEIKRYLNIVIPV